jgi:hypothetical protein
VADADPLFGVYGLGLCPQVCEGCYGPTRTVTRWSHSSGKHTTNGAEYYCNSPSLRVDRLDDERLQDAVGTLGRQELGFVAAAGGSYLTLLAVLLMLLPITGLRRHRNSAQYAHELDQEISRLSQRLGQPSPVLTFDSGPGAVLKQLRYLLISIVVSVLLIALSLAT